MNNNKKILERINKILNNNINILLNKFQYNQPIKSSPKIHYVDFKKLEKYKKSNQHHHKI
jgi:hypothetical protein